MRVTILSLSVCVFLTIQAFASVVYETKTVMGVGVKLIRADLKDPDVSISVVVADSFPTGDENFKSMLSRSNPVAAVDGTFFSKGAIKKPIGDIVVEGQLVHFGGMGTALAITEDNQIDFREVEWGRHADWTGYKTVLACGPTLLLDGQVAIHPEEQQFRDPHVLNPAGRVAVGITKDRVLLIVVIKSAVSLKKLAEIMQALGAYEAMNLDGGASMALYHKSHGVLVSPGRKLTNLLVVYDKGSQTSVIAQKPKKPEKPHKPEKPKKPEKKPETKKPVIAKKPEPKETEKPVVEEPPVVEQPEAETETTETEEPEETEETEVITQPEVASPVDWVQKGKESLDQGDFSLAGTAFKKAIGADPANPENYVLLADVFRLRNQEGDNVSYAQVLSEAAKLYLMKDDVETAYSLCKKALVADFKNLEAQLTFANTFEKKAETDLEAGNTEEARMKYFRAVELITIVQKLDPENLEAELAMTRVEKVLNTLVER